MFNRSNSFFCYLKGRGPLKKSKKFAECRGIWGLSIDTTHTPPPWSFYTTFNGFKKGGGGGSLPPILVAGDYKKQRFLNCLLWAIFSLVPEVKWWVKFLPCIHIFGNNIYLAQIMVRTSIVHIHFLHKRGRFFNRLCDLYFLYNFTQNCFSISGSQKSCLLLVPIFSTTGIIEYELLSLYCLFWGGVAVQIHSMHTAQLHSHPIIPPPSKFYHLWHNNGAINWQFDSLSTFREDNNLFQEATYFAMRLQAGCANYRIDPPSPWNYVVYWRSCVISWVADFANNFFAGKICTKYCIYCIVLYSAVQIIRCPPSPSRSKERIQTVYVHLFTCFFCCWLL